MARLSVPPFVGALLLPPRPLFPRNGSTASKPPSRDHQPNPVRAQPEVSIPRLITVPPCPAALLPCCPALLELPGLALT